MLTKRRQRPVEEARENAGEAVIRCRGVSKRFAAGDVVALAGTSFDVGRGEVVSLLGPSGCGKTTLLRIFAGLLDPSGGEVSLNGLPPAQARQKRAYGMVFQQANLFEWRTVRQNVELPLELEGIGRRERAAVAAAALDRVGLSEFAGRRPWELSGGMQQRVAIARALSFRPAILLMDEPFGQLDEMTREQMNLELLRIAGESNVTVVFVTHSISEAVFLSDRVLVMTPRPGRVVRDMPIALPAGPRTALTRQLPDFFAEVNAVRDALHGAGGHQATAEPGA
jgi:NitT/TauT family transport system ATP-binding protein